MPRRVRGVRRSPTQVGWDDSTTESMVSLGRALREARLRAGLTQSRVADLAGVVQGTISAMERGRTATISLLVVGRAARACGTTLHVYLERASGAAQPRDITHLRAQSFVVDLAHGGRWRSTPEAAIDDPSTRSRSIDVLLERTRAHEATEVAVIEVIDWFADVGASLRDWDRRLARVEQRAVARHTSEHRSRPLVPRVSGCWVIRATGRNRQLLAELHGLFTSRFPGSGRAWLQALVSETVMPSTPALLWISVKGERIWPCRL